MVKKGLGKGLAALIPTLEDVDLLDDMPQMPAQKRAPMKTQSYANGINEIDLSLIDANPNQPRKNFSEAALNDLAESIRTHGVLQPIVVNKNGDRFTIIAGERRYRASKMAGRESIPAIIKEFSSRQIKELALIENLQREDLNPIEIARGFKELMIEHSYTQEMLAERLSMQRSSVANYLRLLSLAPEALALVENGTISLGHAKVLAGVEDKAFQVRLAKMMTKDHISVRKLEGIIKMQTEGLKARLKTGPAYSLELRELIHFMQEYFGTKVSCMGTDKKGRIIIDYYSRDDLDRIQEILRVYSKFRDKE